MAEPSPTFDAIQTWGEGLFEGPPEVAVTVLPWVLLILAQEDDVSTWPPELARTLADWLEAVGVREDMNDAQRTEALVEAAKKHPPDAGAMREMTRLLRHAFEEIEERDPASAHSITGEAPSKIPLGQGARPSGAMPGGALGRMLAATQPTGRGKKDQP